MLREGKPLERIFEPWEGEKKKGAADDA